VVFLGLVAALGIDVKLVQSQTKEADALGEQYARLFRQGRYSEAIPLVQRVLAIREKALGRVHRDVAQSLNDLARLYVLQGSSAYARGQSR